MVSAFVSQRQFSGVITWNGATGRAFRYRWGKVLIVDVYNVLHVTGVLPPDLAGLDVLDLADLVHLSRYGKGKTFLVCDGFGTPTAADATAHAILKGREPRAADFQGILFAGRGKDADSLIETLLGRFGGTRSITVVSSDRRIGRAARGLKSRWLRSDEFLLELVADVQRSGRSFRSLRPSFASDLPLSQGETERWMHEFGIEAGTAPNEPSLEVPPKKASERTPSVPDATPRSPVPPGFTVGRSPMPTPRDPAADRGTIDPLLYQALRMWPGRISLDDFDMETWLGDDGRDPEVDKYR